MTSSTLADLICTLTHCTDALERARSALPPNGVGQSAALLDGEIARLHTTIDLLNALYESADPQAAAERASLLTVVQQLAALRSDAGFDFDDAVDLYLPELEAIVDHADAVLAGRPFDAAGYAVGYAGGGGS